MTIETKTLANCTLLQVCEWLAFNWLPMSPIDDALEKRPNFRNNPENQYNEKIREKALSLYSALSKHKLIATGHRRFKRLEFISRGEFLEPCTPEDKSALNKEIKDLKEIENKRIRILNFLPDTKINIWDNKIIPISQNIAYYHTIEVDFYELQKIFPAPIETRGPKSILSKDEIEQVKTYANTLEYKSNKITINKCIDYAQNTFGKTVHFETMRGYLKSYFSK